MHTERNYAPNLCTRNILVLPHTAGSDYIAVNTVLTFSPTDTRQCVNVQILDDEVVENDEIINLNATLLAITNPLITIAGSATITILDEDGEYSQEPPRLHSNIATQKTLNLFTVFSSLSSVSADSEQ